MKELHDFPVIVARSRGSCVNRWHVMRHDSSWGDRGSCNYFDCFCFQRHVICDVLRNSLRDLAIISCSWNVNVFLNFSWCLPSDEQDRLLQHSTPGRSISQIGILKKLMWLAAAWHEKCGRVIQYNVSFKWDIQRGWLVCLQRTKKSSRGCFRSKSECVRRYTNQDVRMIFSFHQKETWTHTSRCDYSETTSTERMLSRNEFLLCCQRRDVPLTRTTGTFLTGEESDFFYFWKKCLFLVASSMELMGCFFSEKIWKNDSSCIISSDNRSWQSFDNMNLNVIVP